MPQQQTKQNLSEALLVWLGRLHLYLKYGAKGEQELQRRYEGQHRNAGLVLLFDLFMALALVVVVAVLAGALYLVLS
ncbi:hypothetical protein SAMN05444128_2845 [Pontibacter indicus]|uniref:Uncharacterized protein n=1 Tax=Pontibacter indicus TaxID=1317125 RepID=A0A1R3XLA5_9BACT|nr:hypothetical protein SAMN05444128_2845 [Pontibacter indicus]